MNIVTNANTPAYNSNGSLHYFIQPAILRQIGACRLAKLLDGFRDDLKAANIFLPSSEAENGSYFDSLAPILGSAALPDRLRAALFTLEAAASPDNRDRLDSAIQRRIPCVSLTACAVDRALELWFLVPEELSQFQADTAPPSPPLEERVQGEEALSQFQTCVADPSTLDPTLGTSRIRHRSSSGLGVPGPALARSRRWQSPARRIGPTPPSLCRAAQMGGGDFSFVDPAHLRLRVARCLHLHRRRVAAQALRQDHLVDHSLSVGQPAGRRGKR